MSKDIINNVVRDFYELAKNDFLIGYHFRHIESFDTHIPKIQRFWHLILLELSPSDRKEIISRGVPKNIIHSHEYLKIKPGEVGRWIILFQSVLKKYEEQNQALIKKWSIEVKKFEKIFMQSKTLFDN